MKLKLTEEASKLNAEIASLEGSFEKLKSEISISLPSKSSKVAWEKSGYLFERKSSKGMNLLSWTRSYCVLSDGVFTVYSFSRQRVSSTKLSKWQT